MSSRIPTIKPVVTPLDIKVDSQTHYEFGGPLGVISMMLGFPCLMYYFWICLEYNQGRFFMTDFMEKIRLGAYPSEYAIKVYMGYVLFSFTLAYIMPGPRVQGLPVPSLQGKKLTYICNGLSSWYLTLAVSAILHWTDIFSITSLIDHFGELMTVSILWGWIMSSLVYGWSVMTKNTHRMSGNFVYDYFMGAPLNPRIGPVDLKMWAEIRLPWPVLFYLSLSCLLKQYEQFGTVTAPMVFMVTAHFLYANACQKGEECIPVSWDIFYEKDGFMLIFWNMAGVPFTYCYSSIYLLRYQQSTAQAVTHHPLWTALLFATLVTAYYIFDTANSQKNRFRMEQHGTFFYRPFAFPQLPWGHLKDPKYIKTEHGNLLLISGWWGLARKPHYTADLLMSLSWGLITGFNSFLPYFYFTFFVCVLTHRAKRDMERCAVKYGKDWERYCERVPYTLVPFIY